MMYVLKHKEEELFFKKRNSYSGGISIVDKVERAAFYTSAGRANASIRSSTSKYYLQNAGYSPNDFIVREVTVLLI